jgi:F-type H+-transporting ATPase subunit delta
MKLSRRVLARHIATQLQTSKDHKAVVRELAAYVVEHRLHSQLELILADVAANLAALGHIEATVTTARPLTVELKQEITDYIKRIENVGDITLNESVDPALLGGVIVETPRKRFDASIATKLKRLRNA